MKHCDGESKNKDQDELKTKASAGGQKVQPTQTPSSSQCQTTGTIDDRPAARTMAEMLPRLPLYRTTG
jgi:hypothetical protein